MVWLFIQSWLNAVPLWVWIVLVCIILGVLYAFFAPFFNLIWAVTPKPVKIAVGAIVAAFGIFIAGKYSGRKTEVELQEKKDAHANEVRDDADKTAARVPASDLDNQLRRGGGLRDD